MEVFDDVGGDDFGGGQIGGFFEGFVFQPEDVEVDLVALDQLFVGEGLATALSFFSVQVAFGRGGSSGCSRRRSRRGRCA